MTQASQAIHAPGTGSPGEPHVQWLLVLLYVRRWWIAGVTVLFTLAAVVAVVLAQPVYRVRTVLAPADTGGMSSDLSSMMGQVGGLAALVGIEFGDKPNTAEAIAILKSREFTQEFIADEQLLPRLFYQKWDAQAGQWKEASRPPTLWQAFKYFDRKIRRVTEDKRTGLLTLEIEWVDRAEAAVWANKLVARVNARLRQRAITEAEQSIQYLNRELKKTSVVAVEQAIYKIIESSVKQKTLANVREEFAFKVLDTAAPPDAEDPVKPRKVVYLLGGPLVGFLIAVLGVVALEFLSSTFSWAKILAHRDVPAMRARRR